MFRIDEIFPDANTVVMQIEGSIDRDAIVSLKEMCKKYLQARHIKISLDLESLLHITKEGKEFLEEIRGEVAFSNVPEFLKLELGLDEA